VSFVVREGRQAYLLCVEGAGSSIRLEGAPDAGVTVVVGGSGGSGGSGAAAACLQVTLSRHEAAEIVGPCTLTAETTAESAAHFLLVEMAAERGSGRSDIEHVVA
jgi:hypothetical protein